MSALSELQKLLPDVKIELIADIGFLENPDDVFGKLEKAGFEIGLEDAEYQWGEKIYFCHVTIRKEGGYSIIQYTRKAK